MKSILLTLMLAGFFMVKAQPIKVACVGDSITEGHGIDEEDKRYPQVLGQLLGNGYEVRNYGISGRTLLKQGDFPYWNEPKYKEVLAWQPDIVVIKLGTNDSKPQNWKYKGDFIDEYLEFIQSFSSLPSQPKIYICLPVPVYKDAFSITEGVVKGGVIPRVEQTAKEAKLKTIDLYKALSGHPEMFPDGVHPDAAGASLLAEAVYKKIK